MGMGLTERDSYSISEFCAKNGISRTTYYELKKTGEAPREMRIGPKLARISREAAEDWRRMMEARAAEQDGMAEELAEAV